MMSAGREETTIRVHTMRAAMKKRFPLVEFSLFAFLATLTGAALLLIHVPTTVFAAQAAAQGAQQSAETNFLPAEVISAADVGYPLQSVADDIVVFDVALNDRGEITGATLLHSVPSLTEPAQESLRSWKFKPASLGDKPVSSDMIVAFAFRHAVKIWNPPPFVSIFPMSDSGADATSGFFPPGILSVAYSDYPASTIAMGATVLQLNVTSDGTPGDVQVVRDLGSNFAALTAKAARAWEFQPALFNGKPVASKVAIAFVFSSRALNPF